MLNNITKTIKNVGKKLDQTSGAKTLAMGAAGEAISLAAGAALLACPVSTPAAIGYLAWKGVTTAADVAMVGGVVKAVYDFGKKQGSKDNNSYNNSSNLNDKLINEKNEALEKDSFDYQLYITYKIVADIVNNNNVKEESIIRLINLKVFNNRVCIIYDYLNNDKKVRVAGMSKYPNKKIDITAFKNQMLIIYDITQDTEDDVFDEKIKEIFDKDDKELEQLLKNLN